MNNYYTSFKIDEFLDMTKESFIGVLTGNHSKNHVEVNATQIIAWQKEFDDLHCILQGIDGRIIFEYSIPSLSKTVDVILLINDIVYVIEYKVNSKTYNQQDIKQTSGYALRLKYFHSYSNDRWIVPILVATDAKEEELSFSFSEDDHVYNTICCNSDNLLNVLETINNCHIGADKGWHETWERGVFKASPTIIDAARNVWRQNNVRGFSMGESSLDTRLGVEDYITNVVVPETRKRPSGRNKSICFVTGVPGAGKTLVGLNVSVALQSEGASMLSGNGPLVKVLTTALKKDLTKNKKCLNRPIDEISVETIIRGAYGYKKEIFEKRLVYTPGEGTIKLRENAELGSQHIIIFDEAQRAWNKEKMIKPGQSGRKYWQEEKFPLSEPGLLLWDMNQLDWGVFICLVGGGQEINTGEAGICEWLRAIKNNPELSGWQIYMADELQGEEYNRKDGDGETIESYRKYFSEKGCLTINETLHLTTCQRSNRSDQVAKFVQELLSCNINEARETYQGFKDKYQIYLTRDIEKAKNKLRERQKALINRGYIDGLNDEEIRIGMLMSSKAERLRPIGYEIKKVSEYLSKVPNWFLDSSDYVRSSNFLEIALNEFFVQGLELDIDAVMWDADFRYDSDENKWKYFEFNGKVWSPVNKKDQDVKRFYMKNAYRVLLTRARVAMIIYVPEGNAEDPTRLPEFYNGTYNYLKSLGLKEL